MNFASMGSNGFGPIFKNSDNTVLGNYVEKFTAYTSPVASSWETITIADAKPNSIIEIVITGALTATMGVRAVGSALNRSIIGVAQSSITMTVKTNGSKQIQVYTTLIGSTTFYFTAQY